VKPYLIGVAGLSGSGKTALARELLTNLPSCDVVTLDSYYHPQSHRTVEERARLNFDHPDALDWSLLNEHLQALSDGKAIEEPVYDFATHTRSPNTRRVEPRECLIVEGILALHRSEVRALLKMTVYVSTDDKECLRRRLERDICERGRTRECVLAQYEETVWPMAQAFVLPSRQFAGLTVSGQEPLHDSVAGVLHYLKLQRAAQL